MSALTEQAGRPPPPSAERRANAIVVDNRTVMLAPEGALTPPGMARVSWHEYYDG